MLPGPIMLTPTTNTTLPPHPKQGPHVLIVDDEQILGEEIVEFLTTQGYHAVAVLDGEEALRRLQADTAIEVMLTDLRMPDLDGLMLAQRALALRDEEHALEVVILTGNATISDATAAVRLRAIDFLMKPLRFATLKPAIAAAQASAARRRAAWCDLRAHDQLLSATRAQMDELQGRIGQLQTALMQSEATTGMGEEAKDAFMSMIRHELRTPLTPIIGYASLIEGKPERLTPEQLRNFAREIREGGERLERAFLRISDLTGLLTGTIAAKHEPCQPALVLLTLARLLAPHVAERQQTISLDIQYREEFLSDATRLHQALTELVDNASRFSPEGTVIGLSVRQAGNDILFEVSDHGVGMTEAEMNVAHKPFSQVDMSRTRPREGLGIGLNIAAALANLLHGRLAISSAPGTGTVASICLPNIPIEPNQA